MQKFFLEKFAKKLKKLIKKSTQKIQKKNRQVQIILHKLYYTRENILKSRHYQIKIFCQY